MPVYAYADCECCTGTGTGTEGTGTGTGSVFFPGCCSPDISIPTTLFLTMIQSISLPTYIATLSPMQLDYATTPPWGGSPLPGWHFQHFITDDGLCPEPRIDEIRITFVPCEGLSIIWLRNDEVCLSATPNIPQNPVSCEPFYWEVFYNTTFFDFFDSITGECTPPIACEGYNAPTITDPPIFVTE